MSIYNSCSLCLEKDKDNGDNLVWYDGLQLCRTCYENYIKSDYNKKIMPLNAIRRYRREIEERETRLQEEINENCKLKTELYGNSISKDKIREKINQLKIHDIEYAEHIAMLEELLEEDNNE